MAREARGLICCAIDAATAERLDLKIQADERRPALHGTAFTESVDAREGTSTGISAADRATTLRALADPACRPADLGRPGHIFPIVARAGGVLERRGHTEAAVDLCRFASLPPAGVICEIMREDGGMASGESLKAVAGASRPDPRQRGGHRPIPASPGKAGCDRSRARPCPRARAISRSTRSNRPSVLRARGYSSLRRERASRRCRPRRSATPSRSSSESTRNASPATSSDRCVATAASSSRRACAASTRPGKGR